MNKYSVFKFGKEFYPYFNMLLTKFINLKVLFCDL
jgi:hypothetical protein